MGVVKCVSFEEILAGFVMKNKEEINSICSNCLNLFEPKIYFIEKNQENLDLKEITFLSPMKLVELIDNIIKEKGEISFYRENDWSDVYWNIVFYFQLFDLPTCVLYVQNNMDKFEKLKNILKENKKRKLAKEKEKKQKINFFQKFNKTNKIKETESLSNVSTDNTNLSKINTSDLSFMSVGKQGFFSSTENDIWTRYQLKKQYGKKEIKNISNEKKSEENILATLNEAYTLTGKAKIKGITDYITYLINNSCKFLIFAHHTEVLNSIEETVKKTKTEYVRIDGQVTSEKKQEKVNKFQKDNSCLVAILGITACATGITLTKASTIIFAELHYTPAIMIQAEDRAHRIGQENNCVNIHYLFASDTLDEIIYSKLNEKFMIVSSTMDNQVKDLEMKKIKEKIGEFVKGDGKEVSVDKRKSVVLGSVKNKTLNEFLICKDMNIHNNNSRRKGDVVKLEFDDNKNNDGKENDIGNNDDINKFFEI
jgi:SNF2 family DNA or RNA helicase